MNRLIYLLKELYAYCTDFVINIANITGLSYYEVNFVIFIIFYPLLLFVSTSVYIYQKSKLRTIRKKTIATTTQSESYFNNIKTFNKRKIFVSANLAWLFIIVLGVFRDFSESTNYYDYNLSGGDYPPEADSISIPLFSGTFIVCLILSAYLVYLNIFIFLTTLNTKLPTKLFIKAEFYTIPVVLWELFFGFWLALTIFIFFNCFWTGYYIEGLVTLFYIFILLNLRAGQISKSKQKTEDISL